jgi:hypothetical protein
MFVERYVASVNSSDLRDDDLHHSTEPLRAAAYADATGCDAEIGSLLCRVKYADGSVHKLFEAGTGNLAHLLRIWLAEVTAKGKARKWVTIRSERDIITAHTLYRRVAEASLAFWMDGRCEPCHGAGQGADRRLCTACAGSGRAQIEAGKFETDKTLDMVSELEGLFRSHSSRAKSFLRPVE